MLTYVNYNLYMYKTRQFQRQRPRRSLSGGCRGRLVENPRIIFNSLPISNTITRWRHLYQTGFQFSRAMHGLQGLVLYQIKAFGGGNLLCHQVTGHKSTRTRFAGDIKCPIFLLTYHYCRWWRRPRRSLSGGCPRPAQSRTSKDTSSSSERSVLLFCWKSWCNL